MIKIIGMISWIALCWTGRSWDEIFHIISTGCFWLIWHTAVHETSCTCYRCYMQSINYLILYLIYLMWGYLFIEENFLRAWLLDKTPTFCSQVSLTLIIVSIRIWSYVTLYVITSSLNVDAFMIRLAGVWYRIEFTWLLICQQR